MKAKLLSVILTVGLLGALPITAQETFGIIGGQDSLTGPGYAALVAADGSLTQLTDGNFPNISGSIQSVAINIYRMGLIGGQNLTTSAAYAALVAPGGALTLLTGGGLPTNGNIGSVAINNNGFGIIGGRHLPGGAAYAALVSPSGAVTQLSGSGLPSMAGIIHMVDINDNGFGIIGGQNQAGLSPPYAALVSPSGTLTQLALSIFPPPNNAEIRAVAINNNNVAIIGGRSFSAPDNSYAAFVAPDGSLTVLSGPNFPSSFGNVLGIGINDSGNAIIGGTRTIGVTANPYASLVAANGVFTELAVPAGAGAIFDVGINSSGAAIIGGSANGNIAYAALVSPSGVLTPLSGLQTAANSVIRSVAINDAGVGLIGGNTLTFPSFPTFAALVAPNGTLTPLFGGNFPAGGFINSVDLSMTVPTSISGPLTGPLYTLLSTSAAKEYHTMIFHKKFWREEREAMEDEEVALLAQADFGSRSIGQPCTPANKTPFTLWFTPFYENSHQGRQGIIPSFNSQITGAIAAIDYWPTDSIVLGGGLAYAFDYMHFSNSIGHTKINQEMAVYYTSYQGDYVFVDATLWGGYYQVNNERHTLGFITSIGKTHGWLFAPHLELCATNYQKWCGFVLEPFAMFDWVNNWQKGFTEKGASGLNLVIDSQYAALLRSEAGLRFYEVLTYCWGRFFMEEKLSYINKAPFGFNPTSTAFIGSASSFSIATGTNRVQNLAGVQFNMSFVPKNTKYPYGQIDFQGEFGSSYQGYFASFEIGKFF